MNKTDKTMADFAFLLPWNLEKRMILMENQKICKTEMLSRMEILALVTTPATELHITISIHFLLTLIEHKDFWQQLSEPKNFSSSFKLILNLKNFKLPLLITEDNTQLFQRKDDVLLPVG